MSGATKLMTAEYANSLFEYCDGKLYWKVKKCYSVVVGQEVGSEHGRGYRAVQIDGKNYKLHRIVFLMHNGYFPEQVDHINGDKTDNRIENLRAATNSENQKNVPVRPWSKTGVKNVTKRKDRDAYMVTVSVNGKRKTIGYYKDLELAELVSIEAQNKHYDKFSYYRSAA